MNLSNTQKRLFLYSFVIFMITELLKPLYDIIDYSVAANSDLLIYSLINTVNHLSLYVGLSGMLIIGIRLMRNKGINLKSIIIPSFGLLFSLAVIFLSVYIYLLLDKISKPSELINQSEITANMIKESLNRKDLTIEIRSIGSKHLAEIKYKQEGLIIDYIDLNGDIATYKPTAEEVAEHEDILKSEIHLTILNQFTKELALNSIVFWILLTICNILLGLFSPINRTEAKQI